ncbi:MAG: aminoacetone oxidase family FAD-binding enzyme [Clostridia bacterium]|nr:aminoacetone oxidase family FAD-binding enzyme [Clostridia bacterium]
MKTVLIVGGGAAGMAAAITAAGQTPDIRVILLERLDRVGKKLLATGNGRCNLTNLNAGTAHYHSAVPGEAEAILRGMEPAEALRFFEELGLRWTREDEGRIYPYCMQASMVLDVLLAALEERGIEVVCAAPVNSIRREGEKFIVEAGRRFAADAVILCAGGRAAPKLGSDGSGYGLAKALGHTCTPLYPALTALCCDMRASGGLKGIRAPAEVSLFAGETCLGARRGEVQFTEYGLSGIAVMDLSLLMPQGKNRPCFAELDLFPAEEEASLLRELRARRGRFAAQPLERFLLGTVQKRLGFALMKQAGFGALSRRCGTLTDRELSALARLFKHWRFSVSGVQGYEQAQVAAGGVPLSEIDEKTMESKLCKGLYLAGEILDMTGDCGGYNLHWAWCSGIRAGRAAGKARKA